MRVAIVTNAAYRNGDPVYVPVTDRLKQRYCDRWGMDYLRTSVNPYPAYHPVWAKLPCMLKALEDHDWAIWMDCDAAPVNMYFDLYRYLAKVGNKVIIDKDWNGPCAGVFAVPATEDGKAFMRYIDSLHTDPKYRHGFKEQAAMADALAGEWNRLAYDVPDSVGWNRYPKEVFSGSSPYRWEPGDWGLHMPHVRPDIIRSNFSEYLDKSGKDLSRRCILGVSMGDKYNAGTDRMIDSFLKHNPGWAAERYYDARLEALLPEAVKHWKPFDKCEIGRWLAMYDALANYDTVLYADGDIKWYGKYDTGDHDMMLVPHHVTAKVRRADSHLLWRDGIANIGIMEISSGPSTAGIFEFIVGEVLRNPQAHFKHGTMWLQNIVSALPLLGFDVGWNMNCGCDVADWNLLNGDRRVVKEGDSYVVVSADGISSPLQSFHFSAKTLHKLPRYGSAVVELLAAYMDN